MLPSKLMKRDNFEHYLQNVFMEDFPEMVGTKDQAEDNYERWIENLQVDDLIQYADRFADTIEMNVRKELTTPL